MRIITWIVFVISALNVILQAMCSILENDLKERLKSLIGLMISTMVTIVAYCVLFK